MSLICTNVTTWITQQVLVPANTWVSQQQQQCAQFPWWDPRGWFCWFVTVLVLVVVWVTQNIVVPTITVVCTFITFVIGWIILVFATVIDAICQTCTAVAWTNHWFLTHGKITFVSSVPSATRPGYSDYTFTCSCPNGSSSNIVVTALNDDAAASQAKLSCAKAC
jgi:hypothetical protein